MASKPGNLPLRILIPALRWEEADMRRIAGIFLSLFLVFFPLFGLQRTYSQQASAQSTSSQQATSLQTSAQHASFSIEQKNGYKLLKAYNLWPGASSTKTYVLYPRGSKAPRDVDADLAIAVPVRRVVLYSTTYIPAIEAIGELNAVVGVECLEPTINPG